MFTDRNLAINAVYDHAIPDQAEVTYSRVDREETELPSTRDHFIHSYKNLPIVETFCNNKIPIETLKQVFNEKRKDCGFKKEFEVSNVQEFEYMLSNLVVFHCFS